MTMTPAQMEAEIVRLGAEVVRLRRDVGDSDTRSTMANRPPDIPINGQSPLLWNQWNLRVGTEELTARVKRLETTGSSVVLPVSSQDIADLIASAYNIHLEPNKLGVGIKPDPDSDDALHIGGDARAGVTGISNTKGTDGQNPGEVHKNSFVVCDNDGGMGGSQYATWTSKNGWIAIRNTSNRPHTNFHLMDSQGDACISDSRIPGQVFYIVKNIAAKVLQLCTYNLGWKVEVRSSQATYGDKLDQQL